MSSILAAARPMVRDFSTTRWRILAALLLIMVPTSVVAFFFVTADSREQALVPVETPTIVIYNGGECQQSISGYSADCTGESTSPDITQATAQLEQALPAGFTAHPLVEARVPITVNNKTSTVGVTSLSPDLVPEGVPVPDPGQIVLDHATAEVLGVTAGNTAVVGGEEVTVIAVTPAWQSYAPYPALTDQSEDLSIIQWAVTAERPMNWDDVLQLNDAGFVVRSIEVEQNPPPRDAIAPHLQEDGQPGNVFLDIVAVGSFWLVVGVLVLLGITPVFTLALGRHTHMFSLMAAQGASPRHIRGAVLTAGLVLGLVGSTAGVLLGAIVGLVTWTIRHPTWPLGIPGLSLVAVWVIGVVGSVVVALVPAIMASRQAISRGIAGGVPDRIVRWRGWMAVGPSALVIIAIAAAVLYRTVDREVTYTFGSLLVLLALLALIASVPALVFAVAALTRRAPLSVRMGGRGLLRRAMHFMPAIALLLASSFVLTLSVSSEDAQQRSQRGAAQDLLAHHQVAVSSVSILPKSEDERREEDAVVATQLSDALGDARITEVYGLLFSDEQDITPVSEAQCHYEDTTGPDGHYVNSAGDSALEDPEAAEDCRWYMTTPYGAPVESMAHVLVQTPDDLGMWHMDDATREEASRVLADGGVILPQGTGVESTTEIEVAIFDGEEERTATVLATEALHPTSSHPLILSPGAAAEFGLSVEYAGLLLEVPDHISEQEINRTIADMSEEPLLESLVVSMHSSTQMNITTPWRVPAILGIMALVVLLLVMALSSAGARRDARVLDSLGAPPELPGRIAAVRYALISLAGLLTGVIAGHVAAWISASPDDVNVNGDILAYGSRSFWEPRWEFLLVTLVVTVVIAIIAGIAASGSRTPARDVSHPYYHRPEAALPAMQA